MPKRMTATEKWDDPWFRRLPASMKLFWIFLLDRCNMAGIWDPDFELVEFYLGSGIAHDEVISTFAERIILLYDGKWFIPKFIPFQYKTLSSGNKMHKPVLEMLGRYDLVDEMMEIKGLGSPFKGAKDKEQDKEQVQDKDKEKEERKSLETITAYFLSLGMTPGDAEQFQDFYISNGWVQGSAKKPIKNWRATARNWKRNKENRNESVNKGSNRKQSEQMARATFKHGPEQLKNLADLKATLEERVRGGG